MATTTAPETLTVADAYVPALTAVDRAVRLGCDVDTVAEVRAARKIGGRWAFLDAERDRLLTRQTADVAVALFSGTITVQQAIGEAGLAETSIAQRAAKILADSLDVATQAIRSELRAIGDRWVTDIIRPAAVAALEPLPRLADAIGAGWSDSTAHRATDPRVRGAFGELNERSNRLQQLAGLVDFLRAERLFTGETSSLRYPDLFQAVPGEPAYSLLQAHRLGAEPGVWLTAECDDEVPADAA